MRFVTTIGTAALIAASVAVGTAGAASAAAPQTFGYTTTYVIGATLDINGEKRLAQDKVKEAVAAHEEQFGLTCGVIGAKDESTPTAQGQVVYTYSETVICTPKS